MARKPVKMREGSAAEEAGESKAEAKMEGDEQKKSLKKSGSKGKDYPKGVK
jgi:hypothetical protein